MGFQLVYYAYFLSYKTLRIFLAALSGFMYFRMNNLHKEDMNFKKIVAVDETLLNEAALKQLKTIGEEVVVYHDFPTEEEEVIRRIGNADCLLVSFRTPIRRSVLDACPNIRYIGMCCTLYNPESSNVDVIEARKRGIMVLGVKDYGDEGVVEYVVSELVRLLHGFGNVRWLEESTELTGRKVGIIGLGNIGRRVADIAKAFGCRVIYYSTSGKNSQQGYERVEFDALLEQSDIVSVHAPLDKNTRDLMNREAFREMKSSAVFLNLGRGPIVVEQDLADALETGEIAGAGLDVLSAEPMRKDNPLRKIKDSEKLIITHIGWASVEARTRLMEIICQQIADFQNQIIL